ncbi:MAG: YgjP-like metallopeptidase domain-containing protein, partial [Sphingomonadaceae bacterium]
MSLFRRDPPVFNVGGRRHALIVRTSPQARRMRLVIDPRDGGVYLTLPKRASQRQGLNWVEDKRAWIEAELARLPLGQPITAGGTIPLEGQPVLIDWRPEMPRTV